MKYDIQVTKEDLKFINAVAVKSYGYGIENVRIRNIDSHNLLFEATDSHILIQKKFSIIEPTEDESHEVYDMKINPEFFKRLIYLCKQKEIINITVDFGEKVIRGETLLCTITSQHVTERKYPDTDAAYPEEDGVHEMIFKKEILEKFLNSVSNADQYLKFSFVDGEDPWARPIVVRSSYKAGDWSEERNLIMGVRPNGKQW